MKKWELLNGNHTYGIIYLQTLFNPMTLYDFSPKRKPKIIHGGERPIKKSNLILPKSTASTRIKRMKSEGLLIPYHKEVGKGRPFIANTKVFEDFLTDAGFDKKEIKIFLSIVAFEMPLFRSLSLKLVKDHKIRFRGENGILFWIASLLTSRVFPITIMNPKENAKFLKQLLSYIGEIKRSFESFVVEYRNNKKFMTTMNVWEKNSDNFGQKLGSFFKIYFNRKAMSKEFPIT